ncbi:MAG: hypothetical protein BWY72_02536 [Bacteroidetes bacterium ADurb.Bin416]|nr:MAG: hypothetical protein BWY72_02536 [Bacteroidetes bacterium ADurb.Bin416]
MRSAFPGVDAVDEGKHGLVEGIVVLNANLYLNIIPHTLDINWILVQHRLIFVQILHKFTQAAFKVELVGFWHGKSVVGEGDKEALVQESQFPQTVGQHVKTVNRRLKDSRVGRIAYHRAAQIRHAGLLYRFFGDAFQIALAVYGSVLVHLHLAPGRQGVDHRHADAVQTAGYLVVLFVKLAAGVKPGHNQLQCAYLFHRMYARWYASAIVGNPDNVVFFQHDIDTSTKTCKGFVDRVVYNFIHQVVQSVDSGRSNVHAWAFAYSFQTFEHLDTIG